MSKAVLVDTNVLSYLCKGDTRAELYRKHLSGRLCVISFVSVAEMYRWAEEKRWGQARRQQQEQYLRNYVTHGYNRELCRTWAQVMMEAQSKGRRLDHADG